MNDTPSETPGSEPARPPQLPGHAAAYPRVDTGVPPPPPPPLGSRKDDRWGGASRGHAWGGAPPPKKQRSRVAPVVIFIVLFFGLAIYVLMSVGSRLLEIGMTGGIGFGGGLGMGDSQIALIRIEEPIMPGMSYDFWMHTLSEVADSPRIKGVMLRLNSPGGAVASSQEIYDEVLRIRRSGKKVYASMGDVAASGAYYIAAAADHIVANRGTLTGSIGVISEFYQLQELAEKIGVDFETIKTGRFKDAGSSFREMSEDERRMFDQLLDNAHNQFLEDILSQRSEPIASAFVAFKPEDYAAYQFETPPADSTAKEFLKQMADGRVYSGQQALQLGLVDELGSLSHAMDRLVKDLKIKGEPKIYEPVRKMGFFELLQARTGAVLSSSMVGPSRVLQYRMPRI